MSYLSFGSDLSAEFLLAFGFSPGPPEMLIILVIALLLYGGKLPEMARTWGKTLAEFRRSLSGIQNEFNDAMHSAKDQLTYQPENDPYLNDPVNETSGYDEEIQDDYSEDVTSVDDASADDETASDEVTTGEDSTDVDSTEELSSEKQPATDTD
jgi:sec-independent protein translocase protein TatA